MLRCLIYGHSWLWQKDRRGNLVRTCWRCRKQQQIILEDVHPVARHDVADIYRRRWIG